MPGKLCILVSLMIMLLLGTVESEAKQIHTGLFGLYAWGNWPEALNITRDNGFDIVIDASNKNALDMCQERGLKSFVDNFGFTPDMVTNETKWQQFLATVRDKVTALKDHPAVFGWYLVDEPDGQKIPVAKVKQMNALVRSIDKKHPIMTVLADKDGWKPYLQYYDIVVIDPYLRKNKFSTQDTPIKVQEYIRKIRRDMRLTKVVRPLWVTIGAFDYLPKSVTGYNEFLKPTPEQFNQMVDYAKQEGVDGILVWTFGTRNNPNYYDWTLIHNEPALWDAVRKLPARVKQ